MINNLGQTFWEGSSIIAADPAQILSKTGFAIDNSSKIFLFVDTREALTIEAFEPGSNNTKSETYPERKATIVRKDVPRIGSTKQAHAAHASIARISSQNILVAWNQYNANFSHEQKNRNELVLQNTNSEHIQMQVLSRKLQEKTPEVQVDTLYAENTGSSSQTNNPPTSEPSRTERDSDMDGIDDLDEITLHKTDPQNPDSDGDGYLDGEEVANNYNPNGICRVKTFRNDGEIIAYGHRRLADISDELCRDGYLNNELKKKMSAENVQKAIANWNFYFNAFAYGNYPISAIIESVENGSATIHTTLSWELYRETVEYKNAF